MPALHVPIARDAAPSRRRRSLAALLTLFGLAGALSSACKHRDPNTPGDEALSPSERSFRKTVEAAGRAEEGAAEHARLAKAIAARLADSITRGTGLQQLRDSQDSASRSATDASDALVRARYLIKLETGGVVPRGRAKAELRELAARAELDATEVERRKQALEKTFAGLKQAEPSSPSPVPEPMAVKSCATGAVACEAPTPYCCRLAGADFQPDGRGECVAGFDQCSTAEFACTSGHKDCPNTQGIVSLGCENDDDPEAETVDANGADVFRCDPGRPCHCKLRYLPGEGRVQMEEQTFKEYNESLGCGSLADCERFCRRDLKGSPKLLSSACVRLVDAAEKLVNGSEGSAGVGRGVAVAAKTCDAELVPPGGARPAQAKACEMAAWGHNSSRDVSRNLTLAARYYERAYKLSGDARDFRGAFEMTCAVETWSPGRREFDMDEWCNHGVPRRNWATLAYSPEDPTRRIESDECFEAMRNVGCTGVNVGPRAGIKLPEGQELKSAFCCRGARP